MASACAKLTRRKRTSIAGLQLSQLPPLGLDHHRRTNESAQAWSIGAKQDRHISGEVDGADGICIVVNVRGMQSGLAAVLARPLRLGSNQPHTSAIGLVMHAPLGREDHLDVGGREKLRLAVWAVQYSDLPLPRVSWLLRLIELRAHIDRPITWLIANKVNHVARAQSAARMAAEFAQHERRAAAQEHRCIDAAGDGQVGPRTTIPYRPQTQHRTSWRM